MPREPRPYDVVAWLPAASDPKQLAGAAFLVSKNLALTCAHVVRDHLGLGEATPPQLPSGILRLDFRGRRQQVEARVAPSGWWPDGGEAELDDLAVLELLEALEGVRCASPAIFAPGPDEPCEAYGAFGTYPPPVGQTVRVQLTKHTSDRGWRQLNPRDGSEGGYLIERGFSGSPVLDRLGNAIWGMVVAVETAPGKKVAFAIPASSLIDATERVRDEARTRWEAVAPPRQPGPFDQLAREVFALNRTRTSRLSCWR